MKTSYKTFKLNNTALFLLMIFACLIGNKLDAQTIADVSEIRPLKIGEAIPDELWKLPLKVVNDPSGKDEITLEQYKGKLILLDFWGTYCSACIAGFPKLKNIQEQNQDKLKILAISSEQKERIDKFFNSEVGKSYKYINSAYDNTSFQKYFPHRSIPHTIWISPEGKYVIPTNTYEVTQQNIDAIYRNEEVKILTKVDKDRKKALLLSDDFYLNNNLHLGFYSLFFQGYYPGFGSGNNFKITKTGKAFGRQFTNIKLNLLFRAVAMHLFEENKEHFTEKRIILNSNNPYITDPVQTISGKLSNDQYYSYELIVPEEKADSLYTYMLSDLNRYLDVKLSLRKQKTNCLVLVRTSKQDKIKSKGDPSGRDYSEEQGKLIIKDEPIANLVSNLNETPLSKLPIIDETGYTNNIDLSISGINNLEELGKSLAKYDIDIKPATRDLLMFVITDK